MLAVSIKPIFGNDDNDDKSDDNVVMKSLFVTKKQHFLELHQDKVCVSFYRTRVRSLVMLVSN